ncbi:hypothetical protein [Methylobacterium sp. Leaf94]|uniref:hypothetical protein n=1 Tax=Methylobacterium sp. Leaf94 TaxID=1736250 RepID=UPI0012E3CD1E|nr:hypothetical protein [Methylobacterium sp. Leaf94]
MSYAICTAVLTLTLILLAAERSSALAQAQSDPLRTSALAIAAFEKSKARCVYSAGVGDALAKIDAILTRRRPAEWEQIKPSGEEALAGLRNRARLLGAKSDCATYGTAVGYTLPVAFGSVDLDNAVVEELSRLLSGAGRSISGEAEARPPQLPAPGSAADTIARMDQDGSLNNDPAAQPSQGFTLKRLPADDPPPMVSRSQPPSRKPATPSPERDRNTSPPLVQAAPSSLPPSLAAPNAATQSQPLTASSSSDCREAGDCRLAQPTFACNLDDAARIAGAGPDAGWQVGLAAVRAGTCEIVAAGHPLRIEATKTSNVVYATEKGQHVGYLPVGVFVPADQAAFTVCITPGFCAVRPGALAWTCPQPSGLDRSTTEAKRAEGCLRISSNVAAEVAPAEDNTVVLMNMVGGSPFVPTRYYLMRSELIGLDMKPYPTPTTRGWCRPGDWCIITVGTLFCSSRTAHEQVMSLPAGEMRRAGMMETPDCRVLVPGTLLKPKALPAVDDARKLIEVEHPVLKAGWASASAFKVVAYNPPVRYTQQLSDFLISVAKSPSLTAIKLAAQGTDQASGTFRAGQRERLTYCKDFWGEDDANAFRTCLGESATAQTIKANCYAKRILLEGRQYELRERPSDMAPDNHIDPSRRWLFRDLATADWLDGSTRSAEAAVGTAFNALCPGVNPEATASIIYRASGAEFPRELQGRWFDNRRACADPNRNKPDYDDHSWMEISAESRVGSREFEFTQRINAVRALGRGVWEIDGTHRIDDATVPEIFQSSTYRLTLDGFELGQRGQASKWVRCR